MSKAFSISVMRMMAFKESHDGVFSGDIEASTVVSSTPKTDEKMWLNWLIWASRYHIHANGKCFVSNLQKVRFDRQLISDFTRNIFFVQFRADSGEKFAYGNIFCRRNVRRMERCKSAP